ncbi:MAG: M56 family metallopeptidase [bacterium]|nr:M56 family metallopeptidase [bacterium]
MKLSNQQKTNFIFYSIVAILFSVIVLMTALIINIYPIFYLAITGHGDMECDCTNHVAFLNNHPYIGSLAITAVALVTLFVIYALFQILKNIIVTKQYINNILINKIKLSSKVKDISRSIGINNQIVEINSEIPEIFCFGFIKPTICISSGLIQQVSKNQLRAILLHEKNHLMSYDPLKLCVANTLRKSLFFIPGIKKLIDYFIVNLELSADERATNNFKEIKPLGSALLKISDLHKVNNKQNPSSLAVSFLSITEVRIDRLINKSSSITFKWNIKKLIIGAFVFMGLLVIIFNSRVWLVEASQIDEMNSDLTCGMEQIESQDEVINNWDNLLCGHSSVNMSCLEEVNTKINTCF